MLGKQYLTFFILNYILCFVFSDDTVVQLPNGKIQGRVAKTFQNTTFYAFQEIPYAAPPVGTLRFKPPVSVSNWNGTIETTKNTKICFQLSGTNTMQNEDCLYLNVYTPVVPNSDQKLPVLVFIHGGGFVGGDGTYDSFGPDFFMDTQKIVVVTINYRLGIFGFLSTEDEVIPGNNGLKDQRSALQWIQENIHLFGGDPAKVTIDGQSAGSASVSYHILSKQSQGLFRAAICESASVLTSWSYQRYARNIAYQTAKAIDSSFTKDNSSEELLALLQSLSAEELQHVAANDVSIPTKHINPGYIFAPVVESGDGAFLSEAAYEAVEKGEINKVPLLMGMNSEETIAQAGNLNAVRTLMSTYDSDLSLIVNDDFHLENDSVKALIGDTLRKIYTDGLFQDNMAASVRFLSDCRYTTSIIKYALMASNLTDIYFYQFSYDGELGGVNVHINGAESVAHSEELHYLWRNRQNDDISVYPDADVLTHKRLVELWTNFITELNPTPENNELLNNITWPLFTPHDHLYLDIREELELKRNPKGDVFQKWDSVYQSYGVRPFDTY